MVSFRPGICSEDEVKELGTLCISHSSAESRQREAMSRGYNVCEYWCFANFENWKI